MENKDFVINESADIRKGIKPVINKINDALKQIKYKELEDCKKDFGDFMKFVANATIVDFVRFLTVIYANKDLFMSVIGDYLYQSIFYDMMTKVAKEHSNITNLKDINPESLEEEIGMNIANNLARYQLIDLCKLYHAYQEVIKEQNL